MNAGIRRSFLKAGFKEEDLSKVNEPSRKAMVIFLTPQKFISLLNAHNGDLTRKVDFLVVDESHHFPDNESMAIFGRIGKYVRKIIKKKLVLSMTATHGRSDGDSPLGKDVPDARITTYELVNKKRCPPICGITTYMDVGDAEIDQGVKNYSVKPKGKSGKKYWKGVVEIMDKLYKKYPFPTIAFVHRIKEAELIAKMFNKKSGLGKKGLAVLTGQTSDKERNEIDDRIRSGDLVGFVTCGVGVESLDIPELAVCHLICRTKSMIRLVQSVGRVIRATDSKAFALVVDYHIKKPHIIKACLGLADYAIDVGVPKSKADGLKQVDVIVGKKGKEPNVTPVIKDIEEWICRSSKERHQEELLAIKKGEPRPHRHNRLGIALARYTSKKHPSFDLVFYEEIKKKQPHWFRKTDEIKKELLARPKGSARPSSKTKIGSRLSDWTNPKSKVFDSEFNKKIRKKQPMWFTESRLEIFKKDLLKIKKGKPRPRSSTQIGLYLSRFTRPNSNIYDKNFHKEISTKHPSWFLDTVKEGQNKLLSLPKGSNRPAQTTKIGRLLRNCTHKKGIQKYPEFNRKIRKKHPKWFDKPPTLSQNKTVLLKMTKGIRKPLCSTSIGRALRRYTKIGHKQFDPIFNAKIRKRQPQWFKK
jgi:superfamily II DNA or RNA helicase